MQNTTWQDPTKIESALRAVNESYYQAFAARDLAAMEALWAPEGVACVHPGWPALIGRKAVIGSYRDIFAIPLRRLSPRATRKS